MQGFKFVPNKHSKSISCAFHLRSRPVKIYGGNGAGGQSECSLPQSSRALSASTWAGKYGTWANQFTDRVISHESSPPSGRISLSQYSTHTFHETLYMISMLRASAWILRALSRWHSFLYSIFHILAVLSTSISNSLPSANRVPPPGSACRHRRVRLASGPPRISNPPFLLDFVPGQFPAYHTRNPLHTQRIHTVVWPMAGLSPGPPEMLNRASYSRCFLVNIVWRKTN